MEPPRISRPSRHQRSPTQTKTKWNPQLHEPTRNLMTPHGGTLYPSRRPSKDHAKRSTLNPEPQILPNTVWFLVGNGGMDYGDIIGDEIGTTMGIHSPIPYQAPDRRRRSPASSPTPGGGPEVAERRQRMPAWFRGFCGLGLRV